MGSSSAITIGTTLGHYRIVDKIGEGGMGAVYRATDTTLGRDVAIKFLSGTFAEADEGLARFEQEARFLASLNHPNVATLYGFEKWEETHFLVMELVSGETLAERIEGGLTLDEAIPIFQQIAEALEAAHEKGVIHRDLKPANIKITPEGQVKVLDFGLAKAFGQELSGPELSQSPTFVRGNTEMGVVLGTAAYMSPEQARGKTVDKRTDIWSFGCVLYEVLTGRKAFAAETVSDTIAKILTQEPDWTALPETTPQTIRLLLKRCLQKHAASRPRHIDPIHWEGGEALPGANRSRFGTIAAFLLGALAAGFATWALKPGTTPERRPAARLTLELPEGVRFFEGKPSLAFSPDGTRLAYVATRGDTPIIYIHDVAEPEATPISGTEGGEQPFFSPDGEWLGFAADGMLKKISLRGGPAITLCVASSFSGGSWGPDDSIVFAANESSGLSRVASAGGTPRELTTLDSQGREIGHGRPEILPGGKALIFTANSWAGTEIVAQRIGSAEKRVLIAGADMALYAPSGYLVYGQRGALFAVPFDVERLETTGSAVPLADGVRVTWAGSSFAISRLGWLVYVPGRGGLRIRTFVAVDRQGAEEAMPSPPRSYYWPRLSPDGQLLATTISSDDTSDVWVYDLGRDALTRLTFESTNQGPVWSPDGSQVAFMSYRSGSPSLFRMNADGSGAEELRKSDHDIGVQSWSPDGRFLAFYESHPDTDADIWVLPLWGDRTPRAVVQTVADEGGATFSPDGRFLAYVSNASGRPEVYVEAFPGPGGKWQISTEGGKEPAWARDGKELFYRGGNNMMAVALETEPVFTAGKPRLLFQDPYVKQRWFIANYDVSPDGKSFVMLKDLEAGSETKLNVVLDWAEGLKSAL